MGPSPEDHVSEDALAAIALAASIANGYAARGGNVIDLFAAYVGIVVDQDRSIGFASLKAADRYLSKKPSP
jgi:hypothetical protein